MRSGEHWEGGYAGRRSPRLVVGITIVTIGVFLLLDRLGVSGDLLVGNLHHITHLLLFLLHQPRFDPGQNQHFGTDGGASEHNLRAKPRTHRVSSEIGGYRKRTEAGNGST